MRHYERELLRGISDYANLHGPWQFYRNVSTLFGEDKDPAELVRLWRPDAIIARESAPHRFDEILHGPLPTIYSPTTERLAGIANIVVDDTAAGCLAADHLLESGFCHFAYCGVNAFFWSRLRGQGFAGQLGKQGHPVQTFASDSGSEFFGWDPGHRRLLKWLKQLPKPVRIFCCTHLEGDTWINGEDQLLCGGPTHPAGLQDPKFASTAMSQLRFGLPAPLVLNDGTVMVAFWCVEDAVSVIRTITVAV